MNQGAHPRMQGGLPATLAGLDLTEALTERFDGDSERYRDFLCMFFRDYKAFIEEVRQPLQQGDWRKAQRLVHKMKGVAGNLSATALHQTAAELEQALKAGAVSMGDACYRQFEEALQQVLLSVRSLEVEDGARAAPPGHTELDRQRLAPLLIQLAGFLESRDTQALTALGTLKDLLSGTDWLPHVRPLQRCIEWFDYPGASVHLETLTEMLRLPSKKA